MSFVTREGAGRRGIAAEVVVAVMHALEELGAPVDRSIDASRASIVDGAVADALLENAARALGDDAIGITIAERLPVGALGDVDYALCTSDTAGEGLARLARYYAVATERVTMSLETDATRAHIALRRAEGVDHSRHWIELSFAVVARRLRQTVRGDLVFETSFVHAAPPSVDRHRAFFSAPPTFSAPRDVLSFAREVLDAPLLTASATLADALADVLVVKMGQRSVTAGGDDVLDDVRREIAAAVGRGGTDVDAIARRLATTSRTLQRRLREAGVSFRALLDEARRDRARELLQKGHGVADVARRLGFSQSSAFFRAYRRWTGTSPKKSVRPSHPSG